MYKKEFIRNRESRLRNLANFALLLSLLGQISSCTAASNSSAYLSQQLLEEIVVEKTSTTFDGTNKDGAIHYIGLDGENGIHASIQPASGLFRQLEYTFMVWLKPEQDVWERQLSYAFVIPAAFGCYFSGSKTLVCESSQVCDKLNISTSSVVMGEWVHLTVSGSPSSKSSYALLETRTELLGQDTKDYVILNQPTFFWEVCIGICSEKFGFLGGVREFVFVEEFLSQAQSSVIKNHYLTWSPKILAYYRFGQRYLNEEYTNTLARVVGKKPDRRQDIQSNDICYPFSNFEQFQYFNQDNILENMTISEYFEPKKQDYSYTFSLWIYMLPDNCYESVPYLASQECFLFQMYDSFMLYQERPNYARFYFYAFKNYYELSSSAFFLPYNQWLNIQLSFSQFEGYQIATYDMQGRELERLEKVYNMQEQFPRKRTISLLPKFRGYVRSFFLLGSKRTLPFRLSINDYIVSQDFIYYLKFQPQFNSDSSYLTNHGEISGVSQSALYNIKPPTYQYLEFYRGVDLGYTDAGTTEATVALFDGVACDDSSYTLFANNTKSYVKGSTADIEAYYDDLIDAREAEIKEWEKQQEQSETDDDNSTNVTNGSDSSNVSSNETPETLNSSSTLNTRSTSNSTKPEEISMPSMISNATVEFWFKPSSFEDINYLFTLYSNSFDKEFFSIFKDTDGNVVCAPFGFISFTSPVAIYRNLTAARMDQWIHMSCSYTYQTDVEGLIYFSDVGGEGQQEVYSADISTLTQFLPFESYDVIIGNSESLKSGSVGVFYKDVKVWGVRRTREELESWRFRQVSPYFYALEELLAYFRLNQANFTETNYLYIAEQTYTTEVAEISEIVYVPEETLVICPQYTYFDNGHCYDKPLDFLLPQVFYILDESSGSISYNFTVRNSAILASSFFQELNIIWYSTDSLMQHFISEQQGSLDLVIPADALAQHRNYWLRTYATNNQSTFIEHNTMQFLPLSCKWVEVEDEGAYGGKKSILDPKSTVDIEITLKVKYAPNGCEAYYDKLTPKVTYVITPLLSKFPELNITLIDDETISVVIPKDEQPKLPSSEDIGITFQVYWTNSEYENYIESDNYLFSSVMYTINFAYEFMEIVPIITQNYNSVLKYDTLIVNANETYISPLDDSQKYDNLTFEWTCPLALQALCDNVEGSALEIPFADFVYNSGRFAYPYTFTVNIYWSTPTGKEESARLTTSATWYNISSLTFSVSYDEPILSSSVNTLKLVFENYDTAEVDEQVDIEFSFSPAVTGANIEFEDATTIVIAADTFKQNTFYTMRIVATSMEFTSANYTQAITFKTKYPPYGGYVVLSPEEGVVNSTTFFFKAQDWQSDFPPIEFQVWQTDSATGTDPVYQLSEFWVSSDFSGDVKAYNTYPFIVLIRDASLEMAKVKVSATISATPSLSGSSSKETAEDLKTLIASESNLNQKYDYMNLLANTVDSDDSDDSVDLLLSTMQSDLSENINRTRKSKIILNEGSSVAQKVSKTSMSDEQILQTSEILTTFSDASSYDDLITSGSGTFVNNIAQSIGNILSQNNKKNADDLSDSGRRRLRQSNLNAREEMQKDCQDQVLDMANLICEGLGDTYSKQQVVTDAFALFVQKYDLTYKEDEVQVTSVNDEGTSIIFQIKDIMTEAFTIRQLDSSSFCTQVLYFKEGPYYTDALQQNFTQSSDYLWIDVVDGQLSSVQQYMNLQLYTSIQFQLDPEQFSGNQTVCMTYQEETSEWDDEICLTEINLEDKVASCYCKQVQDSHYALLTDYQRKKDETLILDSDTQEVEEEENNEGPTDENELSVRESTMEGGKYIYLSFVVFLVLFEIVMPLMANRFDKKDYIRLETKIDLNSLRLQQLRKIAEASNKSVAYWKFKQDDIMIYNITSLSTFSILLLELHPILGFLHHFDLLYRRMLRFSLQNVQVGLYALICVIIFGFLRNSEMSDNSIEQEDVNIILIVATIGMVVLLPYTSSFSCLTSKHIPKLKGKLQDKSHMSDYQIKIHEAEQELNDILVQEKCSIFKFFTLLVGYVFIICAVVLAIIYSQDEDFNQQNFCVSFFMGVFGSWFLSDVVYIFIQSQLLNLYATTKSGCLRCLLSSQLLKIQAEIEYVRAADYSLCQESHKHGSPLSDQVSQKRLKYEEPQNCDFDEIVISNKQLEHENNQDLYQTVQEKRNTDLNRSGLAEISTAHKNHLGTVEDMHGEKDKEGGEPELCDSVVIGEDRRGKRMGVLEKVRSSIEKSQRVRYSNVNHEHTLSSEHNK